MQISWDSIEFPVEATTVEEEEDGGNIIHSLQSWNDPETILEIYFFIMSQPWAILKDARNDPETILKGSFERSRGGPKRSKRNCETNLKDFFEGFRTILKRSLANKKETVCYADEADKDPLIPPDWDKMDAILLRGSYQIVVDDIEKRFGDISLEIAHTSEVTLRGEESNSLILWITSDPDEDESFIESIDSILKEAIHNSLNQNRRYPSISHRNSIHFQPQSLKDLYWILEHARSPQLLNPESLGWSSNSPEASEEAEQPETQDQPEQEEDPKEEEDQEEEDHQEEEEQQQQQQQQQKQPEEKPPVKIEYRLIFGSKEVEELVLQCQPADPDESVPDNEETPADNEQPEEVEEAEEKPTEAQEEES